MTFPLQDELKKLPERTRNRLETLKILHETEVQANEFLNKLQPSITKWTFEDIEMKLRKLGRKIRTTNKRKCFASRLAKLEGGDSLFEIKIKKMLEQRNIQFKFNEVLKLGTHRYRPDFLIGTKVILEVAGVPIEYYWKHYNEKVGDYVNYGFIVYIIVPNQLFEKAKSYLPNSTEVTLVKYGEFKHNFDKYARMLTTNYKAVP